MRSVSVRYLRSKARAAVLSAVTILVACAVNSPPPPSEGGESDLDTILTDIESIDRSMVTQDSPDSSAADYDRLFLEIHSDLTARLRELGKTGKDGTRLAEIESIVKTAEEFYLEGKPVVAIKLLTEAELLLRLAP
jgi:hypothetical protein